MDDEVDNFLAHYGVKGMKWGVRRKRATVRKGKVGERFREVALEKNQKQADRMSRLASGKSTAGDKLYAAATMSAGELIVNRGLRGAASNRVSKLGEQKARLESGRTTVRDKLQMAMTTSTADLLIKRVDR